MVLQSDDNLKNKGFKFESHAELKLLESSRFPYGPMGASLLFHAGVLMILAFMPFSRKMSSAIDFEKETITYYKLSEEFPDISPLLRKSEPVQQKLGASDRPNQLPELKGREEIAINPIPRSPLPLTVEQPELPQITALPRLELPNILMNQPKTNHGEEPISVTQQVPREINKEIKQMIAQISPTLRREAGLPEPLPMQQSPHLAERSVNPMNDAPYSTQKLNLPLPVEPSTVTPRVSQIQNPVRSFGTGVTLLVGPPVDNPEGSIEVKQFPLQDRPKMLAYSTHPALPKGELVIPKVNAPGSVNASPRGGTGKGPGGGREDFGNASISIPNISIKNRVPMVTPGTEVAIIQAPKPSPPVEENKNEDKPAARPLKELLPPLNKPLKISSLGDMKKGMPSDSPLAEVERQGKPIYTAAINAPNFTSKRGSWIFRFAELVESSASASFEGASNGNGNGPTDTALTPPSATVKVDPRYRPDAIRDKVEGVVVLYAVIRKDGSVDPETVRVVRKLDPRLDLSAKEALLQWKFRPSQRNGKPVDIQTEITIPFYFRRDSLYR